MEKPRYTPSKETKDTATPKKKTFVAPKLEKMDVALTESSVTISGGSDGTGYSS